ncbi:MAG: GNAT family N-acetyltransferase [Candidatus Eiseniibacteriota bacterium]
MPRSDLELIRLAEHVEARATESYAEAAPAEIAGKLGLAGERIGPIYRLEAAHVDVLAFNRAFNIGMDGPAREEELDRIDAAFVASHVPRYFVQIAPGAGPAAISDWLTARGFKIHNRWMRLARDPAAPIPVGAVPQGWRVEHIGTDEADAFAAIDARGFGYPREVEPWTAALVGRPGWRHYMAFDGDIPVGTGAMFTEDQVGWFGFAATLEAYRGRGVQSSLIAFRLAEARLLGLETIVVETAEDLPERPAPSYRNLIRLGFRTLYARDNWIRHTTG